MVPAELFMYGFFGFIFLLAIGTWLHSRSIDPPLENEEYLARNPELRELKREKESKNDEREK